jgi:F0F1-type ATP synthase assembly protein I
VKTPDGPNRAYGEGWIYVSHGITFAVAVVLWALAGIWLDRRLGTMPLFTVLGTVVGMGLSGFWLLNRVRAGNRR